jgi:hypothetical protein
MKVHELIDFLQRKVNSLLFRFILVSYATLLLYAYPNQFHLVYYLTSFVIYLVIYFSLLNHDRLRLLNDFWFIGLILFGKDPHEPLAFIFLILPIINSINFSGQKQSFLLYIYTIVVFLAIACFNSHNYELKFMYNSLQPLIAVVFLWLVNVYTSLRVSVRAFREELNSVVDNFYLVKEDLQKPHKIYKKLIEVIHRNTKPDLIEDIICFVIVKGDSEKLVIVNGSSFIWQVSVPSSDFITRIRKNRMLLNESINIEKGLRKFNLSLYCKVDEQEYIFVFITTRLIPFYYLIIGFFRTLTPAMSKVSRVLLSEKKLQELKNEEIIRLSERSQYVNRANKTMHFIRNRLGPFSNLLKMLNNLATIPPDKLESFQELLIGERDRARIELSNITERANNMLEKNNNPFAYNALERISVEKVFTVLKRNFNSFFPEIDVTVEIEPGEGKRYVLLNEEGFELFLSDWLNNMQKYKKEFVSCGFTIDKNCLILSFENDHSKSAQEIGQVISDLTSSDRNEIMRRTTHGLYTIKSTLEDMKVSFEVFERDSAPMLVFKLNLSILENENSSF